jgi:hypothetical protein
MSSNGGNLIEHGVVSSIASKARQIVAGEATSPNTSG